MTGIDQYDAIALEPLSYIKQFGLHNVTGVAFYTICIKGKNLIAFDYLD
jgi:hypothetical protein